MRLNHQPGEKCKSVDLFFQELNELQNKYDLLIVEVKDGKITVIDRSENNKIAVEQICYEITRLAKKKQD